jgi:hypothetical protein
MTLDLDPIEVDPSMLTSGESGGLPVPWLSPDGQDPYDVLDNDTQRELYEELAVCFPPREANAAIEELYESALSCFDPKTVTAVAALPDPTDVFTAVYALNVARPDLYTVCHQGSHTIGKVALKRVVAKHGFDEDLIRHLIVAGRSTCMGGLVHGVLDSVASMTTDLGVYEKMINACLSATEDKRGYCSDAVGHSSWDAFESAEKTAEVCAIFPEQRLRFECVEGVLMRMYQRKEDIDKTWYNGRVDIVDVPKWNREIADICAKWPSTPFDTAPGEDPRLGCWSGSIYPLFQPLYYHLKLSGGEYQSVKKAIEEVFDMVVETCESYGPAGSEVCLDRLGHFVAHATLFDQSESEMLCRRLPRQVADCITHARLRIENAFEGS